MVALSLKFAERYNTVTFNMGQDLIQEIVVTSMGIINEPI